VIRALTANAVAASVLDSIPAFSYTVVESEGAADEAVLNIVHEIENKSKKYPFKESI
jgi:hypothetical protein